MASQDFKRVILLEDGLELLWDLRASWDLTRTSLFLSLLETDRLKILFCLFNLWCMLSFSSCSCLVFSVEISSLLTKVLDSDFRIELGADFNSLPRWPGTYLGGETERMWAISGNSMFLVEWAKVLRLEVLIDWALWKWRWMLGLPAEFLRRCCLV